MDHACDDGTTPLYIAAQHGRIGTVKALLPTKSCLWEPFWQITPRPRGGASVELSEGESDPSQTYVSRLRVPVSPMGGGPHPGPGGEQQGSSRDATIRSL